MFVGEMQETCNKMPAGSVCKVENKRFLIFFADSRLGCVNIGVRR